MNGETILKYIHWVAIGLLVLIFLIFIAPKVVPPIFSAIWDLLGDIFNAVSSIGK